MRRLLFLTILAIFLAGSAFGMARKVQTGYGLEKTATATAMAPVFSWERVSSITVGGLGGYDSFGNGKIAFSGHFGINVPGPASWLGGKFYFNLDGYAAGIEEGKEYGGAVRLLYFFAEPYRSVNLFLICGLGPLWQSFDPETPLAEGETIGYLLGTYGAGAYFRIDNYWGIWLGGYFDQGSDLQKSGLGLGVAILI